jgi:hypothetical protein
MALPLSTDAITHGIQLALASDDAALLQRSFAELAELRQRGRLANGCIALLTSCAFLIGLTIILLFLGETTGFQSARWAVFWQAWAAFCWHCCAFWRRR